mgnify:CR=1 FL=1
MGSSPSILTTPREFLPLSQILDVERIKHYIAKYVENPENGRLKERSKLGRDFDRILYQLDRNYIAYALGMDEMKLIIDKVR